MATMVKGRNRVAEADAVEVTSAEIRMRDAI
jgi:hypothetical protein